MSEVENFFFEKFKLAFFIVSLIDIQLACACRRALRACRGRGDCPDAAVPNFAKKREKKTTPPCFGSSMKDRLTRQLRH